MFFMLHGATAQASSRIVCTITSEECGDGTCCETTDHCCGDGCCATTDTCCPDGTCIDMMDTCAGGGGGGGGDAPAPTYGAWLGGSWTRADNVAMTCAAGDQCTGCCDAVCDQGQVQSGSCNTQTSGSLTRACVCSIGCVDNPPGEYNSDSCSSSSSSQSGSTQSSSTGSTDTGSTPDGWVQATGTVQCAGDGACEGCCDVKCEGGEVCSGQCTSSGTRQCNCAKSCIGNAPGTFDPDQCTGNACASEVGAASRLWTATLAMVFVLGGVVL